MSRPALTIRIYLDPAGKAHEHEMLRTLSASERRRIRQRLKQEMASVDADLNKMARNGGTMPIGEEEPG